MQGVRKNRAQTRGILTPLTTISTTMMAREEDLAPDIRKDLHNHDNYKTFEDSYHANKEGVTIKGFRFFNAQDSVLRSLLGVGEPTTRWFDWMWRIINVQLLFLSSIIWETLLAFLRPTGYGRLCREQRQKKQHTIHLFQATWMVLTGVSCLASTWYKKQMAVSTVSIKSTMKN